MSKFMEQIKKQSQNLNKDGPFESSHCILKVIFTTMAVCLYVPILYRISNFDLATWTSES